MDKGEIADLHSDLVELVEVLRGGRIAEGIKRAEAVRDFLAGVARR